MPEDEVKEQGQEENKDSEQVEQADYPMPEKSKPLKVNANEMEYLVIVPKGVKAEYPQPEESDEGKSEDKGKKESKPDNKEEDEKIKALTSEYKKENEELKKQVDSLENTLKEQLTDQILSLKEKKQLNMVEGEKEKYLQYDVDTLKVVLSEVKSMKSQEGVKQEPKAERDKQQLSDKDAQKAEIKKKLFGEDGE